MRVQWNGGISLPDHGLWLDPQVRKPVAFVSHAHSDHLRRHDLCLMSRETAALLPDGYLRNPAEIVPWSTAVDFGQSSISLLPSGHILGSAQVLFEHDGVRLLYTGDLKLHPTPGLPRSEFTHADILIMEATYGLPDYRFPDPQEVTDAMASYCAGCLSSGVTPVLFVYALGKSQSVMLHLAERGLEFAVTPAIARFNRIYADCGIRLPPWETVSSGSRGKVILCPRRDLSKLPYMGKIKCAQVTGWAFGGGPVRRAGADGFALSDHCDYFDLLDVIAQVKPSLVYTVHGFDVDLARQLRRLGHRAQALKGVEQIQLAL